MKRLLVNAVHSFFQVRPFESILRSAVKGKDITSALVKFIPPNHVYDKKVQRIARDGQLTLFADLYDYNDWKAYWGVREIERERLYALASSAKTVVDIGVNNGWVLLNLARIAQSNKGFVYGFEPFPPTYQRCIRNIEASKISNCKVFNMGCSDKKGELVMISEIATNSGQNRIVGSGELSDSLPTVAVEVVTLDEQLSSAGPIDLIKIDVEGFEFHVLKGAKAILERDKPDLFIEIDDKLLKANGTTARELLLYLQNEHNYHLFHATSGASIKDFDNLNNCHMDVICSTSSSVV